MMGSSHATTGAAVWLAATAAVPGAFALLELDPVGIGIGAIVCAGAALLPDADHPSATIAHSIPVFGKAGANAVNGLAGGHRHGTHSLLSIPIIVTLTWLLQFTVVKVEWWDDPLAVGPAFVIAALIAFAVKVLGLAKRWPQAWTFGAVVGIAVMFLAPEQTAWLPLAIVLGFVTHLIGDFLTIGGLPLLWPWNPKPPKALRRVVVKHVWRSNGYFSLPIVGKTGSARERWIVGLVSAYIVYIAVAASVHALQTSGAA